MLIAGIILRKQFIDTLTEHGFKNKTIGFIENGTWNPVAAKRMRSMLEECKNITFTENTVKIFSALKDENIEQINNLAKELVK